MLKNPFDWSLALYAQDWTPLGQAQIDPDWEPAREWVRLLAQSDGRSPAAGDDAEVRPVWHRDNPRVIVGFRVAIAVEGEPREVSCAFPTRYFRQLATHSVAPFVESGCLAAGETFRYLVLATAQRRRSARPVAPPFVVTDATPPPVFVGASMEPLVARALAIGEPAPNEAPAFVSSQVLDEIAELSRHAGALETGGALIGHLCRDAEARRVYTRVTAQLPARHTEASAVSLLFTSETWSGLRDEIARRGKGERLVGWHHSHPVFEWCRLNQCQASDHDGCASDKGIFSEQDRTLHRTVFAAAHSVALVANLVTPSTVRFSAYGWSLGMIQARSVSVVGLEAS